MTEPQRFTVRHVSVYRYSEPVRFGEHRMMFRPRASHDLRLVTNQLLITPTPSRLHWLHDVFDNSVAVASFTGKASELRFDSEATLEHFETPMPDYALEPYAVNWPFAYTNEEASDLVNARSRQYPDSDVNEWACRFVPVQGAGGISGTNGTGSTMALLRAMTRQLPRFRGADDGRGALTRSRGALCQRISVRARAGCHAGRRCDACLAADLFAGRRLGRFRSDQ
jgi:Bacterial transglutaminase-like N-terminal region